MIEEFKKNENEIKKRNDELERIFNDKKKLIKKTEVEMKEETVKATDELKKSMLERVQMKKTGKRDFGYLKIFLLLERINLTRRPD